MIISQKSPFPRGENTQHRRKSQPRHGFTPMLPRLYGGFGPLAASPEPSDGAASAGTGPSGLGSKFCAVRGGLCRAKRQPGQGGDNAPPPRSFAHPGTNSLARPSSAIIILPSQKNPPLSPLQVLRGTHSSPKASLVTAARRNDTKPVLLWVGSRYRPQGFIRRGGGVGKPAGEAPKISWGGPLGCSIP